jgi:hypothetical protein
MKEHRNKLAGAGESPMQSSTSSEDQLRNCRALATANGWDVLDEYIRSDEELTGRTLVGREGIADLTCSKHATCLCTMASSSIL